MVRPGWLSVLAVAAGEGGMGDAHPGDRQPSEVMLVLRQKKAQPLHPLNGASQRSLQRTNFSPFY